MTRYELAVLAMNRGALPRAVEPVAAFAAEGAGQLLGCWIADVGTLNTAYVLRGFADDAEMAREQARTMRSSNPFGCARHLTGMTLDGYAPFTKQPPIEPGAFGPVYEVRTYMLQMGALEAAMAVWAEKVSLRTAVSRLVVAMHTLNGAPRMTHIWPYADANERVRLRAKSIEDGIWPPKLPIQSDMRSTLCVAAAGSPLS